MMNATEIAQPETSGVSATTERATPEYLPVSLTKLFVMSTVTFGFYDLYWFYKNWQLVKKSEGSDIDPALRAFFGIFFCYSLFKRVEAVAAEQRTVSIQAGLLAAGWIIAGLLWGLPAPYLLIALGQPLFLLPVQRAVNAINQKLAPGHNPNNRFGGWNIVAIVIGGLAWVLLFISLFNFPEQT
jgi:hypothetical protein